MSEDYTNLKYELIPYDNFVGSDAFDFNKTIYDLNSQIELMLSRLVDTFFSRTSWTMLLYAENHSISVA